MALARPSAQTRQSPYLPDHAPHVETGAYGVVFQRRHNSFINLRAEDKIKGRLAKPFTLAAPKMPNKMLANGKRRAIWLGPDESLLLFEAERDEEIHKQITTAFKGTHFAATIVTDALTLFELSGPHIRDMLAKGCSLDLHPDYFKPGDAAQSLLSHAAVTLACEDNGHILLICRTSFSDYVESWMKDASIDYGYEMRAA